jgi:iron complex outermembrane receptor protein
MKINFLLITLYCFSFKGIAQVDPIRQNPIPQDSVANTQILTTVVLSASYQKASGVLIPTEKITESVLQNFTPIDLVDAINQTSGVYIQSGAINTNRITIRGVGSRTLFGTNKIRAYFNGIPITSGAGETNIDSYDTNSLSTIEIVKGPKATQYGSNIGGTILLSTKEANKDGLDVSTTFSAGSYGLFKNTTSASYKEKDLSAYASYGHLKLDGYRDNSKYNRNSILTYTEFNLSSKFKLGALIQHYDNSAEIPSSLSQTSFNEDPTQAAFTWGQARGYEDNNETLAGLTLTSEISQNLSNTTSVFYTYLDHYEPRPFNILDEITNGYGARTIFAKEYKFKERQAILSFGGEWYQDRYQWQTIDNLYQENNGNGSLEGALLSDNKELRSQFNLFGTTTVSLAENWKVEAGLNINKTQYEYIDLFNLGAANKSADRDFDPIFAPNLSISYTASNDIVFFGNVSRGFNYPSIEETLTPDGTINPDIGPEKGWNYEVGGDLLFFKNTLRLKSSFYLLSIDDLVVAERVGDDQFIGRNAGKTNHRGVEMSLQYVNNIAPRLSLNTYINADFNAHKFIDFVDESANFSGNDLTGIPKKKMTTGVSIAHETGFNTGVSYRYIGSQPITDANTLYSDAYQLLFAKAGYKKEVFSGLVITISAGINNVLNTKYASSILINASAFGGNQPRYFYPGNPRNYFSSVGVNYNF